MHLQTRFNAAVKAELPENEPQVGGIFVGYFNISSCELRWFLLMASDLMSHKILSLVFFENVSTEDGGRTGPLLSREQQLRMYMKSIMNNNYGRKGHESRNPFHSLTLCV